MLDHEGVDTFHGGNGKDSIVASNTGDGTERSCGGAGHERIQTGDADLDIIDCGKGAADEVVYDDNEVMKDGIKNRELKQKWP